MHNNYITKEDYLKLILNKEKSEYLMDLISNIDNYLFLKPTMLLSVNKLHTWTEMNMIKIVLITNPESKIGDIYIKTAEFDDYEIEKDEVNNAELCAKLNFFDIFNQNSLKPEIKNIFTIVIDYHNMIQRALKLNDKILLNIHVREIDFFEISMLIQNNEGLRNSYFLLNKSSLIDKNSWLNNIYNFYNLEKSISLDTFVNENINDIEDILKIINY